MSQGTPAYSSEQHNVARVSRVRLFLRALGVSFFSLLSLGVAFYAFVALPQVQDLLFDARPYIGQEIVYWAGFYLIGIFIWALPLVYTARLLLMQNFDVIGVSSEERFRFYIFRLPTLFAVFAFAAVFFGIIVAGSNLPAPSADGGNPAEVPLRAYLERHLITLFIATAGVLVLVIVRNFFIVGYDRLMERLEKNKPEVFKNSLIRFENLSRNHRQNLQEMDIHLTALKPDFLSDETWARAQRVKVFMWRYLLRLTVFLLILVGLHFLSYSDLVQKWVSLPQITESGHIETTLRIVSDSFWMKRAAFLFFVFGAWLPIITFLAILSNRWQFPLITSIFATAIGLTIVIGDGHDARILTLPPEQQAKLHPVGFFEAVNNWKIASGWTAKGCDQPREDYSECPRPIIVAGEGGGSRAAFLLASVLGNLEDDSLKQVRDRPGSRPFHQQLFAISSVSGSSVGAAFYISALQKQAGVPLDQLKKSIYQQRLWFLNVAKAGTKDAKFLGDYVTYKDALQATLSNDFLSPVVISYLARDVLTISRLPYVMDRAGVLETSWEEAFNNVYGTTPETSPLSAPLHTISPTKDAWTPLLFLNSTSIETGRRIVFTPVKMTEALPNGSPLLIDAYDGDEILCSEKDFDDLRTLDKIARFLPYRLSPVSNAKCSDAEKPTSIGLRLSTAAGMSSRSPFVSPHANLRDKSGQIADSAVDGGYFDNSGAVTAFELATALKSVDSHLNPYIIQISSEPDWFKNTRSCGAEDDFQGRPEVADEADFKPFGTLGNVLTINATRVSRGYETIVQLPGQIARLNKGLKSSSTIYICPQRKENFFYNKFADWFATDEPTRNRMRMRSVKQTTQDQSQLGWKSVSLSWWLSPPLQAYLDAQVFARHNQPSRSCVLSLLQERNFSEQPELQKRCG